MIIILMGVSGSGKTTIGELLSRTLGWAFFDADDFHPVTNIEKMAAGIPLSDADRRPWLETLREKVNEEAAAGRSAIFACSALKRTYRDFLLEANADVRLVFLKGTKSLLAERLAERKGHFMKTEMLASQLATLEEPDSCVVVDISAAPEEVATEILRAVGK